MFCYRRVVAVLLHLAALLLVQPGLAATNRIAAELIAESAGQPGGEVILALAMNPARDWHGYWLNPGDAGQGMMLDWVLPSGASAGAPQYPVPQTLIVAGLMNHVYDRPYAVLIPLRIPANAVAGGTMPVSVNAEWLACSAELCVPERATLSTRIRIGDPAERDPRFDQWRAAMPAPLDTPARFAFTADRLRIAIPLPSSVVLNQPHLFIANQQVVDYAGVQSFSHDNNLLIAEIPRAAIAATQPDRLQAVLRFDAAGNGLAIAAQPGPVPPLGELLKTRPDISLPLLGLILAALAGGLLLNVMPCVFPILSLKALSLARAGESEAQARREGVAYTAGVVIACTALGALLLGLRAAGEQVGWAFQLQQPLVVAALMLLTLTITANLAGLFEISGPSLQGRGHNRRNAFLTGLLAAVVATPCTGPFMATAMGAALLLPVLQAMVLFAALGLGLALPFLALAFVPALRRRLPRPGPWMGRFRRGMAIPMGLTALALLWLASRVAGAGFALALGLIAVILLCVLIMLGRRQHHGRGAGWQIGAALAGLAALSALGLPGMVRQPVAAGAGLLPAQAFSEPALAAARAAGKPVFAWFTADWCLTCKVNEQVAIEREETRAAFARAGVVVLKGDWTRRDPAITRYLTAQGAAGVPLYVWYPANGGTPVQLPQLLTPQALRDLVAVPNT